MKRKLIVVGPTPPPVHGVAVSTESLIRALRSAGHLAAHLDTRDPRTRSNIGKFDLENVRLGLRHATELTALIRRHPGAAVYVPISQSLWGFLRDSVLVSVARLQRRPVYLHLHGGGFHDFYGRSGWIMRLVIRRVVSMADQAWVLTPSLRRCFAGLMEKDRMRVVQNVVDDPLGDLRVKGGGSLEASASSDNPADRESQLRILFLSNLRPEKGCFELIDALALLPRDVGAWRVRYVGAADPKVEREMKLRLSRELPGDVSVELVGERTGRAKEDELRWADVLAFPTLLPEGQPLVLLEALGAGLPIITTRHGGIPETVRNEVEGLLLEPGDVAALAGALGRMASDPALRARLGRNARLRYEECYRPERLNEELDRVLS